MEKIILFAIKSEFDCLKWIYSYLSLKFHSKTLDSWLNNYSSQLFNIKKSELSYNYNQLTICSGDLYM